MGARGSYGYSVGKKNSNDTSRKIPRRKKTPSHKSIFRIFLTSALNPIKWPGRLFIKSKFRIHFSSPTRFESNKWTTLHLPKPCLQGLRNGRSRIVDKHRSAIATAFRWPAKTKNKVDDKQASQAIKKRIGVLSFFCVMLSSQTGPL